MYDGRRDHLSNTRQSYTSSTGQRDSLEHSLMFSNGQTTDSHSNSNNPFATASSPHNTSTNAVQSFQLRSDFQSDEARRDALQSVHYDDAISSIGEAADPGRLRTRQPRTFDPTRHVSVVSADVEGSSNFFGQFLNKDNPAYRQSHYAIEEQGAASSSRLGSPNGLYSFSKPNLWNPHMTLIPKPCSGIAFPKSNTDWSRKLFRSLPTLDDVLARRSGFPLCLYHYFSYLRDVEHCENILEFWLDLSAHEELCRLYVKQLDYDSPNNSNNQDGSNSAASDDPEVGMAEPILPLYYISKRIIESDPEGAAKMNSDNFNFEVTNDPHLTEVSRQTALAGTGPAPRCMQHGFCQAPWPSLALNNEKHVLEVTRDTIRASAENLYYRYLVDSSPREIPVPSEIRNTIGEGLEQYDRIDPEIFHLVKRQVYHTLRDESFPRFLRECAIHNITSLSPLPRFTFGLLLLFISFVFEFSLIFLNVTPKGWRFLPLAGFIPGWSWVFAGLERFDPWLTLISRSELRPLKSYSIRISYIRELHYRKAAILLSISIILSIAITIIFWAVPGHRL
ncbi:Bud site selection protein, Revert to axial protein 1 [Mycoemilia scoparia]|uniref:Bud site selection protein, Revert to axial protein 1 n=1 Tax=Mycoemilia scoparia TaxID=417184 RepID=A0A9W8A0U7_9FUNG|nr:Bud site selection protein, Revert to axial protein 1 [Mycoemilia scoparia]